MLTSGIANGCFTAATKKAATSFGMTSSVLRLGVPQQRLFMNAFKRNQLASSLPFSQVSLRKFSDAAIVS